MDCFLSSFVINPGSLVSKSTAVVLGQIVLSLFISKTTAAHERTQAPGVTTINAVGVLSIARRKRNHHDDMIRRVRLTATSARLSATKPKPPLCNKRSVALKACSKLLPQRTHNNRSLFTRAFAADVGSNVSLASINAQVSWLEVAYDKAEHSKLIRPDEAVPNISIMAPRGSPPPVRASISGTPLDTKCAGSFSPR